MLPLSGEEVITFFCCDNGDTLETSCAASTPPTRASFLPANLAVRSLQAGGAAPELSSSRAIFCFGLPKGCLQGPDRAQEVQQRHL